MKNMKHILLSVGNKLVYMFSLLWKTKDRGPSKGIKVLKIQQQRSLSREVENSQSYKHRKRSY